jgi:hypothetical protein
MGFSSEIICILNFTKIQPLVDADMYTNVMISTDSYKIRNVG